MPQEQENIPEDYASPDQAVGEEQILLHIGSVHRDQNKSVCAHDGGSARNSDQNVTGFHFRPVERLVNGFAQKGRVGAVFDFGQVERLGCDPADRRGASAAARSGRSYALSAPGTTLVNWL